jgi:CheY-like chemotaxis protein
MFNKKILIVDDDVLNKDLLADYLMRKGFKNVLTAAKADETLQKIKTEKPDLIILDIALEDYIDGVEILRRTKAGLSPNSKVVMLSGHKGAYENECQRLGAVEFWSKPIKPNVILENIKRLLSTPQK